MAPIQACRITSVRQNKERVLRKRDHTRRESKNRQRTLSEAEQQYTTDGEVRELPLLYLFLQFELLLASFRGNRMDTR
jgi:hypothetical protein